MANPAAGASTTSPQLTIHHISDIFYGTQDGKEIGGSRALHAYVNTITAANRTEPLPDIIIITGNVTIAGNLEEFKKVADILSPLADKMVVLPRHGIYLVPGPSDLYWTNAAFWTDSKARKNQYGDIIRQNRGVFRGAFDATKYILPFTFLPPRNPATSPDYLVHLLDTCYMPIADPPSNEKMLSSAERLLRKYAELHFRGKMDEAALLAAWEEDIRNETGSIQTEQGGALDAFFSVPTASLVNNLRIIATHHPLVAFSTQNDVFRMPQQAGAALKLIEERNFQLLLHGHTQRPGAIITSFASSPVPGTAAIAPTPTARVQIGGGTFLENNGKVATYNKIVARRGRTSAAQDEDNLPFLSLSLQVVPVSGREEDVAPSYFILGNATADVIKGLATVKRAEEENEVRRDFIDRSDRILRELTNMVKARTMVVTPPKVDLDSERAPDDLAWRDFQRRQENLLEELGRERDGLLDQVKNMLRLLVFRDYQASIGYLKKIPRNTDKRELGDSYAKDASPDTQHAELKFRYMMPTDVGEEFGRNGLPYIATMAGWSLILGEIMTHPFDPKMVRIEVNRLFDSKKQSEVVTELTNYIAHLTALDVSKYTPDIGRLGSLLNAVQTRNNTIESERVFMAPSFERNGPYKTLISVPVPIWTSLSSPMTVDDEMGVLQIDLIEDLQTSEYLTELRKDLLRRAADLVWLILSTARSLRNLHDTVAEREQVLRSLQEKRAQLAVERTQISEKKGELEKAVAKLEKEKDDLNGDIGKLKGDVDYYKRRSDGRQ